MFNLAFLVIVFPITAFALIVFFFNRNKRLSAWTAIAGIGAAGVVAYGVLFQALGVGPELAKHPFIAYVPWFPAGQTIFSMGWLIDPLSAMTLFMVTTVCLMIFIYSQGYMHGDPRYSRFFAYISLFATGMLGLVISSNLLELFVFWEIMGLCSYLLIGFWSVKKPSETHIDDAQLVRAAQAAKKAFLTTRVGDTIFFTGMMWLYIRTGSLDFETVFKPETLEFLAHDMTAIGLPSAVIIGLLILAGTIGKSAQFPLHVWLPDAMEGPTPVSALIHAATMVAAGVYLIARTYPIFTAMEGSIAMEAVAIVGAFTALFASTIGLAQNDIKRVLAYSTVSQLGYMVAALGIGAFAAGSFHLITHAFFKALLFLTAGSVIHGVHTNDMMKMGGLRNKMPITTWVFIIGGLALMGIPPFAGFWSKDEILAHAFEGAQHGEGLLLAVYVMGTLAAFFTALYTGRQIFLTFFGEARDHHAYEHAHESPPVMWVPLAILAFFATTIGFIGAPQLGAGYQVFVSEGLGFHVAPFDYLAAGISFAVALAGLGLAWLIYGRKPLAHGAVDPLSRWLGPIWTLLKNKYYLDQIYGLVIEQKRGPAGETGRADSVRVQPGILMLFLAWLGDAFFVFDRWIVDGTVNLAGAVGRLFGNISGWIDRTFVDGLVNQIGLFTNDVAAGLKLIQTGRVQNYLLIAITGATIFAFLFLIR
ncbi:MAG: NADH-quinone oxidoreductase subunit L [Chloroflexi bacterium]|nr:NADH-quinone oxidoreductase subunit L [Chloroflexota bacterium]